MSSLKPLKVAIGTDVMRDPVSGLKASGKGCQMYFRHPDARCNGVYFYCSIKFSGGLDKT